MPSVRDVSCCNCVVKQKAIKTGSSTQICIEAELNKTFNGVFIIQNVNSVGVYLQDTHSSS